MESGYSNSLDTVTALERSGALLSAPDTIASVATAISQVRVFSELEEVVRRIHLWTEGELPLRGPALQALFAKADEFLEPIEKAQAWLWGATAVLSTPETVFDAPGAVRLGLESDVQDLLGMLAPKLTAALSGPSPRLACAACAVLSRLESLDRETFDAILEAGRLSESDDVLASIVLVIGLALGSKRPTADQATAAHDFLLGAMRSTCRQLQCMATAARALALSHVDAQDAVILGEALAIPIRISGVLGWGPNGDEALSSARYAALVLRWTSVPEASRSALVRKLLQWSGGELGAAALYGVAFAQEALPTSGLVRDALSAEQQLALREIGSNGSYELLQSLGFGPNRDDIFAFLEGEELPWRPVAFVSGVLPWHYLKLARAVASGEVEALTSAKVWLNRTDETADALDCCLADYWFLEQLSDVAWAKHQEFVLAIVDEMSHWNLRLAELLEQAAARGSASNSALLCAALLRIYDAAETPWPEELDDLLREAVTSAKVAEPLRGALRRLPLRRLEAVLATFPALPFWDVCLTAPVVREMLEFVRLFPEHFDDVSQCFRRGDTAVARDSLGALREGRGQLVDRFLVDLAAS